MLNPAQLDEWFDTTAKEQYTKELLFSTIFDLMGPVVQGSQPSVHAAFQASKEDIVVSVKSVYNKFIAAGPLPVKSLVVYDPQLHLPIDVFPCEDGHAQERSMLKTVPETIDSESAANAKLVARLYREGKITQV